MSTTRPQPLAGVSASSEQEIMTVFPSNGCTALGRMLGNLFDSIPVQIGALKLSRLLFPLPTAPLSALIYFVLKLGGRRYTLTNRSVQIWVSWGKSTRLAQQVALTDIDSFEIVQRPGQAYYRCADIVLRDAAGKAALRLDGVPWPEVFHQTLEKAQLARTQVSAALATIDAR